MLANEQEKCVQYINANIEDEPDTAKVRGIGIFRDGPKDGGSDRE